MPATVASCSPCVLLRHMSAPKTPRDAVEQYLTSLQDVKQKTRDEHQYRLRHFVEWTDQVEIDEMTELEPYDLERYKNYRIKETECTLVTLKNHIWTLKKFLRWCENTAVVEHDLSEMVMVPTVSKSDEARDVSITDEFATAITDYLSTYEFASNKHIVFHTLYHTGLRRSGLRSLDVSDWRRDQRTLQVRHRPSQGTGIKGGSNAERNISVTNDNLAQALNAWIDDVRPNTTDDHGREPLLSTVHGRMHYQTVNRIVYQVTQPCYIGHVCPHDRDPETCEATEDGHYSKCPTSVSSHPIRRSSITHHLSEDVPKEIVSERMSVTVDVLETHYDARDKEQRRENRMSYLNNKDL